MKRVTFNYSFPNTKRVVFDTEVGGLIIDGKEFVAGDDGILIYDKTKNIFSEKAICQMSTNTSTLIPALRVLGIAYNPYFDTREVVESQNDITFFWKASRLAAFYNRFSTDGVDIEKRESIIRKAIDYIQETAQLGQDFLPEERLNILNQKCRLLGFYEGFPIFDAHFGMPQLKSRLGIHIGTESVLVSTPMNEYVDDVFGLAKKLEEKTGISGSYKKNRVRFEKNKKILKELGLSSSF